VLGPRGDVGPHEQRGLLVERGRNRFEPAFRIDLGHSVFAVDDRGLSLQSREGCHAIEVWPLDEFAELHTPLVLLLADRFVHFAVLHDLAVPRCYALSFVVGSDHGLPS
jgi:hypothetical protein